MSDIDFDELDKAVNTLMSGVDTAKRNTTLDDPEDKVVVLEVSGEELPAASSTVAVAQDDTAEPVQVNSTSEPDPVVDTEEVSIAEPAAEASAAVATSASPSLAVKRRGQFMDMIHPSSDMKSSLPRPTRREGVIIAPSLQTVSQESAASPSSSPEKPVVDTPTGEAMTEPLVSPFLPDAKPEKRPLGSPTPEVAVVENIDDLDIEEQNPVLPAIQTLPEELTDDILAVESNDLTENSTAPIPVEATAPAAIPEAAPANTEPVVDGPSAGGSIPQQYAESPSTGDQTSGSIYDTANYHQPIEAAAPAKKSSPLKWILLAVGLLVIGGGAGVGYFLLTH